MNQVWKSAPNLEKGKGIPYQNLSSFYTFGALDDTREYKYSHNIYSLVYN